MCLSVEIRLRSLRYISCRLGNVAKTNYLNATKSGVFNVTKTELFNIAKSKHLNVTKSDIEANLIKPSTFIYRKYPNLVRTQVEIISDPNYLARILFDR